MGRFVPLAIAATLVLMGLFHAGLEAVGLSADLGALARAGMARVAEPPTGAVFWGWLLESVALVALFLLVQGRSGAWWLDGLATGWIAWIFRGPVLVVTLFTYTGSGSDPWWPLTVRWFLLYSACGVLVAAVARKLRV